MTSIDPYFYYSSKLREACLNDAKLITVIGYSYADDYVNNILSQALKAKDSLRLVSVGPVKDEDAERKSIAEKLNLTINNQIIIANAKSKQFMTEIMTKDYLTGLIAEPTDVPFQ